MEHLRTIAGSAGIGLAVLVLVVTLLPLVRHPAGWIRIFDFPRLQAAIVGLLAITLLLVGYGLALGPGLLALATACAVAWQLVAIWPFTRLAGVEVEPSKRDEAPGIRILISNVLQDNRHADRLLAEIARARPDLVLAMETDARWAASLAPLHAEYPHRLSAPLPNTYGMILYSRLPLEDAEIRYLIEPDVPSVHATLRLEGGARVRLHGVHPRPPGPVRGSAERDAELVVVGRMLRAEGLPAVVFGDLNDVAWSATTRLFRKVSGTLDPRKGRGLYPTFHADIPVLRFPLDHVFHTPEMRLRSLTLLPHVGSDHFPVLVELAYEPEAWHEQPHPEPDTEDLEEAHEVIDEVRPEAPR